MKSTIALLLVLLLVLTGCSEQVIQTSPISTTSSDLLQFNSIKDARNYVEETHTANNMYYGGMRNKGIMMESMAMDDVRSSPSNTVGGSDFSTTTVQYESVDEADFIKNDGQYIYMISKNQGIIIIDSKTDTIISTIDGFQESGNYYNPNSKQLFLNDNKLVLLTESYRESFSFEKYNVIPYPTRTAETNVYIYDISDRTNPTLSSEFQVSGSYFQSRMINDILYVISKDNSYGSMPQPYIQLRDTRIMPPMYYFPNNDASNFHTIASFNIADEDLIDSQSLLLGNSNTLMVSEDAIYISYVDYNYNYNPNKDRFYDVTLPLLEGQLKTDIEDIIGNHFEEEKEWSQIELVLSNFFEKLHSDKNLERQFENMLNDISDALDDFEAKSAIERTKTNIHKFDIDDGKINHVAETKFKGTLLNQFSLDDTDGYLRVATTVSTWARERIQFNNVYIFDEDLKLVGELENIAKDERIYSTRFLDDKLYMVTFRQTDPFFVIDLTNPEKPFIAGELKLPGYSNYLHPFDENHVLGFGKDTTETKFGFTTEGLKIALFNVEDITNPVLVDEVIIGDKGSDSALLHDHRALLFDGTQLVLPVSEVTSRNRINEYRYSNNIWYGAYVFDITTDGFKQTGKIEHNKVSNDYFSWRNDVSVLRSLFIGNKLYTVSQSLIKVNDKGTLIDIADIKLLTDKPDLEYDDYPYPVKVYDTDEVNVIDIVEIDG